MLTNKIFNVSALKTLLSLRYTCYQILLCLLSNIALLTIKCSFAYYQRGSI